MAFCTRASRTASVALKSLPARSRIVSPLCRSRFSFRTASTSLQYTTDHEWIAFDQDSGIGTVGITNYAQESLGDIAFVELPTAGAEISKGDQIGAVESVKAASDIFAPVSGAIEEINEALDEQPGLVNKDPEGEGWLCKIKIKDSSELKDLLDAAAYKAHCEGEEDKKE